jgi:hypothetical protein
VQPDEAPPPGAVEVQDYRESPVTADVIGRQQECRHGSSGEHEESHCPEKASDTQSSETEGRIETGNHGEKHDGSGNISQEIFKFRITSRKMLHKLGQHPDTDAQEKRRRVSRRPRYFPVAGQEVCRVECQGCEQPEKRRVSPVENGGPESGIARLSHKSQHEYQDSRGCNDGKTGADVPHVVAGALPAMSRLPGNAAKPPLWAVVWLTSLDFKHEAELKDTDPQYSRSFSDVEEIRT